MENKEVCKKPIKMSKELNLTIKSHKNKREKMRCGKPG